MVLVGFLAVAFTGPFSLDEFCGRTRSIWVLPVFEQPRYTAIRGEIFIALIAAAGLLYLLALRLARGLRSARARLLLLVLIPLGFVAVLAPGYPLLANDIFKYVFDGRILSVYGENPFLRLPAEFPDDRFYDLVTWKAEVNAHGPVWRLAEAAAARTGGENCERSVLAMKLWPTLGYLGTELAIFLALRATQPARAISGTMMYAWNPLVLLESLQNGHNDAIAALPMFLAVWVALGHGVRWALPLIALSALIKPLGLLMGGVLAIASLRRGRSGVLDIAIGSGIGLLLAVAAFAPFWAGPETFQGFARSELFTDSPAALLLAGLERAGVSLETGMSIAGGFSQVGFALGMAALLAAMWRGQLSLAATAAATFVIFGLVGAQWFNPWYLLWLVPLAAIAPEAPTRYVSIAFTLLAPAVHAFDPDTLYSVPVVFGPMAVFAWRWRHGLGWPVRASQQEHAAAPIQPPDPAEPSMAVPVEVGPDGGASRR